MQFILNHIKLQFQPREKQTFREKKSQEKLSQLFSSTHFPPIKAIQTQMLQYSSAMNKKRTPSSFYRLSVQKKMFRFSTNLITLFHFLCHAQSSWMSATSRVKKKSTNKNERYHARSFKFRFLIHATSPLHKTVPIFDKFVWCTHYKRRFVFVAVFDDWHCNQLEETHRQTFTFVAHVPLLLRLRRCLFVFLGCFLPSATIHVHSFVLLTSFAKNSPAKRFRVGILLCLYRTIEGCASFAEPKSGRDLRRWKNPMRFFE